MKYLQRKCYKFSPEIKSELKPLYKLDNWHGVCALLQGYLIIAISIILTSRYNWLYPVAIFIIGSRQRALATVQHEASHHVLTKDRFLNNLLGDILSGCLIFQDFNVYTKSHVQGHHIFLGDKDRDPDYEYHLQIGLYNDSKLGNKSLLLKSVKLITYIFSYISYIFKNRFFASNHNSNNRTVVMVNLFILSMLYIVHGLEYYVLFWLIPLFICFPIIGWFIEVAEHYPLVSSNNTDLYMTRNRFSHYIEAIFFSIHNENYHLVHHLKPGIPFWNLKKAHAILLKDNNYRELNHRMGGIFCSANNEQTVFRALLDRI